MSRSRNARRGPGVRHGGARLAAAIAAAILIAAVATVPAALAQDTCDDQVSVAVTEGTVAIEHTGALYNCCPDEPTFLVGVAADTIRVTETVGVTDPCRCLCCTDLSVTLEEVPEGTWQLCYRWNDEDGGGWAEHVEEITIGMGGGGPLAVLQDHRCVGFVPAERRTWGALKGTYR